MEKLLNFNCFIRYFVIVAAFWRTTQAVIPYPPTIIKQPPPDFLPFQVAVGTDEKEKPFMLECEAKGEPKVDYRWTKSGQPFQWQAYDNRISQQPGQGTLIITQPSDVDEGYYQCFATNEHGTAMSNGVFVRKSELNSFPDEQVKPVVVNEGDPLSLQCNPPTGFPKPAIFWIIQSDTGALKSINSSRITVDPEGRLHFSNVTRDDSQDDAVYACSASIVYRNEYKLGNKVKLDVLSAGSSAVQARSPPKQQFISPPNIVAMKGESLGLYCIFSGTPLPEVRWKKKGKLLPTRRTQYLNYGKTLKIRKVEFDDEDTYECTASNGMGTVQTRAMTVTVQAKPYWISEPSDKNAAEDEDVEFECKASGVPEPEVKWFMNGVALNEAKPNPRRKVLSPTSILIEKLEKTDTAVYQCNVSNIHGYVFKNFYVNVLAIAPEITTSPEPKYEIVDGWTIRLSCEVFGSPKPVVKWTRNNQELTGNRFTILENGDLEIRNALFTDAGHYQCIAKNKFGEKKSNENLGLLEVKEQTRITVKPEDYEVPAGQSATFRCEAAADPDLDCQIIWLKEDQIIDFDQDARLFKATDNSLSISKTKELDSGKYTCVASTRLDNVTAEAMLIVQDVPNKPSMVGVECNSLTAKVEWQPMGDNRAPILSYKIQYNTSFTPDSWEDAFSSVPASDFKFEVAMSPWATYTFRVIARNKIGESPPSPHSDSCQTPPDVPYKNPENVVGKGTTPTNLVISWTPMPPIEHNAEGFFYRVYYRLNIPDNAWMPPIDINDWKTSQYEVRDQETFKEYLIKVEAHNSMGQANVAAMEVTGYSGEDVPALAPANLTLLRIISGNSAEFGWEPVPQSSVNGHFKGYKIQTWLPGENPNQGREMIVASNITRTTVEMLVPFADNSVQVLVFNGRFNGPPSKAVTFKTPEGVPGPVQSFEAVAMGANALYLMWKKPMEENGILTGYKLNWEKVKGTKLSEVQGPKIIQNPGETRTKLGNLEPGTKYRVTIRAMTSVGDGVPYFIEDSTHATGAAAPDKPTFTWMLLPTEDNKAGVRVTWLPNVDGHPGSQFFVQYRRKDDAQFTKTSHETNGDSIEIRDLDPGTVYEMGVVAVDGVYMIPSDIEEIETIGAVFHNPNNVATAGWFIGMMCAIAILLLILIIVCIIKRNRGGKYSVHEKEAARAQEMDYPEDTGFNEYTRPPGDRNNVKGSKTSLTSSVKPVESDTDSMADYGEGETGKFTEDGSFIGQYGASKRKEREETSPGAIATFV